jgi:hypothetical protein
MVPGGDPGAIHTIVTLLSEPVDRWIDALADRLNADVGPLQCPLRLERATTSA